MKGEKMPRLIDVNKQLVRLYRLHLFCEDTIKQFLISADTVDAVEVVRCKDCRFYLQSNEKCELVDTRLHFYETDKRWTEDSYCSWGERR